MSLLELVSSDSRSARILEARLVDGLTLEAIGLREGGITRERVRQIVARELRRVPWRLKKHPDLLALAQRGRLLMSQVHSLRELALRLLEVNPPEPVLRELRLLLRLFGEVEFPEPPPPSPPSVPQVRSSILEAVQAVALGPDTLVAFLRGKRWARLRPLQAAAGYGSLALCNYVQVREQIGRLLMEGRLASELSFRYGKRCSVLRLVPEAAKA